MLLTTQSIHGQFAKVRRVSAQTADGVIFSAWLADAEIKKGTDIIIRYKVLNRSARAVYLVHTEADKVILDGDAIVVAPPISGPDSYGRYDYAFTSMKSGTAYEGRIVIAASQYPNDADKKNRPLRIRTYLAYLTDIAGLNRRLQPGEDPSELRTSLFLRAKIVAMGELID
jgi:hypothetical protein